MKMPGNAWHLIDGNMVFHCVSGIKRSDSIHLQVSGTHWIHEETEPRSPLALRRASWQTWATQTSSQSSTIQLLSTKGRNLKTCSRVQSSISLTWLYGRVPRSWEAVSGCAGVDSGALKGIALVLRHARKSSLTWLYGCAPRSWKAVSGCAGVDSGAMKGIALVLCHTKRSIP